jgi:hypothetical protein
VIGAFYRERRATPGAFLGLGIQKRTLGQERFGGKDKKMKRVMMGFTIGTMLLGTTSAVFARSEVGQRQVNQQRRIGNGVANGKMNAHQAAHVEHQEANLNKEIRTDRQANGGKLTPQEHQQVNQQQNGLSREIYNDKH